MLMFRSTHELRIELERLKLEQSQRLHKLALARMKRAQDALDLAQKTIRSQQETIKLLSQDLVILRGAGRVVSNPQVKEAPISLPADVHYEDESEVKATRDEQINLVNEARKELEDMLDGFDRKDIPPELVEAATPKSLEDWQEEHKQ